MCKKVESFLITVQADFRGGLMKPLDSNLILFGRASPGERFSPGVRGLPNFSLIGGRVSPHIQKSELNGYWHELQSPSKPNIALNSPY
jgi:hypothetical protein